MHLQQSEIVGLYRTLKLKLIQGGIAVSHFSEMDRTTEFRKHVQLAKERNSLVLSELNHGSEKTPISQASHLLQAQRSSPSNAFLQHATQLVRP